MLALFGHTGPLPLHEIGNDTSSPNWHTYIHIDAALKKARYPKKATANEPGQVIKHKHAGEIFRCVGEIEKLSGSPTRSHTHTHTHIHPRLDASTLRHFSLPLFRSSLSRARALGRKRNKIYDLNSDGFTGAVAACARCSLLYVHVSVCICTRRNPPPPRVVLDAVGLSPSLACIYICVRVYNVHTCVLYANCNLLVWRASTALCVYTLARSSSRPLVRPARVYSMILVTHYP